MNTNAYMAEYMKRRYHMRRAVAIAVLGGVCVRCGSTERLELDHIDRTTKALDLGHLWSIAADRYAAELAKCQVLCHDCHKAKSIGERSVDHGGGASGKKNCKCEPCRARKREYQRNYMQNRRASA